MWYLDWQFWSAVAAFSALVLSQLPPLKSILKKGEIELKKQTSILIHHSIGTPNVNVFVSLKNVGGRAVNVNSIRIQLTRDGKELPILIATGYFADLNAQQTTMFTPFELGTGESWAHTINCHEKWDRSQRQKFRAISSKVRDTISDKLKQGPLPNGDLHEANAEQIKEIHEQFVNNFQWLQGEYSGLLQVMDSNDKVMLSDEFKFTIFESESNELKAGVEDYRYGYGIHLPISQKQQGIWIDLVG
ncbi:hypothetical protein [Vibrio parahaemolyticus]|uniref:Uncharacterized protein n=1 Tax=Vibrio parahaemolyticus TaxID=670 RepID=A0A7Y0X6J6_VIBPH|nr:hypothetical protein [Vibrio parahaemolyticus]EHC7291190.1 hypothetical protein [Vibrio parahaemolyticus]EJE4150226.1 hypothetical protein [Vibrio parahaemolyticus]ELU0552473.1 hypothetical protein [Vibrio parahaemolyticus]MCZ5860829.1 hypothetical protein [Vibrio parahaemolyticus]MCZ6279605.1 hypothetical protein [Vibrio parahaemolyticus]